MLMLFMSAYSSYLAAEAALIGDDCRRVESAWPEDEIEFNLFAGARRLGAARPQLFILAMI